MSATIFSYNQRRLFATVMNIILAEPERWDQGHWHGTIHNPKVLDGDGDPFEADLDYDVPAEDRKLVHKCGTSHCFAGWVDIVRGLWSERSLKLTKKGRDSYPATSRPMDRAKRELGIQHGFAEWMFCASRTMGQLYVVSRGIVEGKITQEMVDGRQFDVESRMLDYIRANPCPKRKRKLKAKPAAQL